MKNSEENKLREKLENSCRFFNLGHCNKNQYRLYCCKTGESKIICVKAFNNLYASWDEITIPKKE